MKIIRATRTKVLLFVAFRERLPKFMPYGTASQIDYNKVLSPLGSFPSLY